MSNQNKVLFAGDVYTIIYDYKNGQYEIKKDDARSKVLLVSENEISRLI
jgi:major membrane immunogen (membrane-anchored lipoprotein)